MRGPSPTRTQPLRRCSEPWLHFDAVVLGGRGTRPFAEHVMQVVVLADVSIMRQDLFFFSPLARDRSSTTCQIRAAIGVMSDSRTHKRLPPRSLAWIQGQGNGAVRLSFVACMQRGLVLPCLDDFASCGAIFAAGSWFSEPGMPKV